MISTTLYKIAICYESYSLYQVIEIKYRKQEVKYEMILINLERVQILSMVKINNSKLAQISKNTEE